MIQVEEALISGIGEIAFIDGHDVGSGEVNIFLFTDNPNQAFRKAKSILENRGSMIGLRVAFRERTENDYQIIWPPGLTSFSVT